jgi:hypothetical protein
VRQQWVRALFKRLKTALPAAAVKGSDFFETAYNDLKKTVDFGEHHDALPSCTRSRLQEMPCFFYLPAQGADRRSCAGKKDATQKA